MDEFHGRLADFSTLLNDGWRIQKAIFQNNEVKDERWNVASYCFSLVVQYGVILKQLFSLPDYQPDPNRDEKVQLWPFVSMCLETRALIESCLVLCHLFGQRVSTEEAHDRFKYWMARADKNAIRFNEKIGVGGPVVEALKKRLERNIEELMTPRFKKKYSGKQNRQYLKVERDFLMSIREMAREIELDDGYFDAAYGFLSSYAHANSYAIKHFSEFRAGQQISIDLIDAVLGKATLFLGIAISEYCQFAPEYSEYFSEASKKIIQLPLHFVQNWDEYIKMTKKSGDFKKSFPDWG